MAINIQRKWKKYLSEKGEKSLKVSAAIEAEITQLEDEEEKKGIYG